MVVGERRMKIVDYVKERGSASVDDLAAFLGVSSMTVRRDLDVLGEEGVINRCHGGATVKGEEVFEAKGTPNMELKRAIGRKCYDLVEPGDSIFFDAGTTVYEIAKRVRDVPRITCVTNDLRTALMLNRGKCNVIICGGAVQKATGSVFDTHSLSVLEDFRFDVGFFGTTAIDDRFEVLTTTMERIEFKRTVPKKCRKAYLVADSSKFNKKAAGRINKLSDYAGVVTDYQFSEEEKLFIEENEINIIHAKSDEKWSKMFNDY